MYLAYFNTLSNPNELPNANFFVDELARQLLLPVSQFLQHKPGNSKNLETMSVK